VQESKSAKDSKKLGGGVDREIKRGGGGRGGKLGSRREGHGHGKKKGR